MFGAVDLTHRAKRRRPPKPGDTGLVMAAGAFVALVALTLVTSLFTLLLVTFIAGPVVIFVLDLWARSRNRPRN